MARSPLPNVSAAKVLSPVCVVSGLSEAQIQALQAALCAETGRLLAGRSASVEVLALNDPRITESGRLVIGLRAHVEKVDGAGTLLTLNVQLTGAQRLIPTAAHSALFDPINLTVTPAIREGLQKCLHESGLL